MRSARLAFTLAATVTGVFFVDLCGLVFRCGCRSLWAGIDADCNIHVPSVAHCPWCEHPLAGGAAAFAAILAVERLACYLPKRAGFARRVVLALAAFPIAGALVGILQALYWGYAPR